MPTFILKDSLDNEYELNAPEGTTQAELQEQAGNFMRQIEQQQFSAVQDRVLGAPQIPEKMLPVPIDRPPGGVLNPTGNILQQLGSGVAAPDTRSVQLRAAAESGIDVMTGLDFGLRGRAALLNFEPGKQDDALDLLVRRQLDKQGANIPPNVPVIYRDSITGEPTYLKLEEDGSLRHTLINPPNVDVGDIISGSAALPSLIGEISGSIVGGIVGQAIAGPGFGTAVGGAAGAISGLKFGNETRILLAKMLGIPAELADGTEAQWLDYIIAAGGEIAGTSFMGAVRMFRNTARVINPKDLPAIEKAFNKSMKLAKSIEERVGGNVQFNMTLGQATGDIEMLAAEATLLKKVRGKQSTAMAARQAEQLVSTGKAFRGMADANGVRVPDNINSVEEVSQVSSRVLRSQEAQAQGRAAKTQAKVDDVRKAIESTKDPQVYRSVRGNVEQARIDITVKENELWQKYNKVTGYDPKTRVSRVALNNPPDSEIRQAVDAIAKDANQSLYSPLAKSHKKFLDDLGFPDEVVEGNLRQGLDQEILDPKHLHYLLSSLKREVRQMTKSPTSDPVRHAISQMNDLVKAVEKQIASADFVTVQGRAKLGQERSSEIANVWISANETTATKHAMFDTENMRTLLEHTSSFVKNADGTVTETRKLIGPRAHIKNSILKPGDARYMTEAVEALGHDPATKAALSNELLLKYVDNVFDEKGIPIQARHNKFMDDYEDHMGLVMGKKARDTINDLGSFTRVIEKQSRDLTHLTGKLKNVYGLRVTDPTNPGSIAKEILSDRVSPKQAKALMADLERLGSKDLADNVRQQVLNEMYAKVMPKNEVIDSVAYRTLLKDNGSTLQALFGKQYVKDLRSMESLLLQLDFKALAKAGKDVSQPWVLDIGRTLFGPLSKKQRAASAFTRLTKRIAGSKAASLTRDPASLRNFVRFTKLLPSDPRFIGLATALGLWDSLSDLTREQAQRADTRRPLLDRQEEGLR